MVFGAGVSGCTETPQSQSHAQPNEPSPNASILPAPLASELEPIAAIGRVDAGYAPDAAVDAGSLVPEPVREDRALAPDTGIREAASMRLTAELRWLDLPPFPRLPEANAEAIGRLRDTLGFALTFDLSAAGRLRVTFDSEAFVLPPGSELRAREDHLGHILLWNSAQSYASIAPGMLRALLSEHRADVAPLTKPKITRVGSGNVLGLPTIKRELGTPLGRMVLEQAQIASGGGTSGGAALLCRLLSEFIAADPNNAACSRRELPLKAELFSSGGGHVAFEVKKLQKDATLDPEALLTPPADARFVMGELPAHSSAVVPSIERLREFRMRPMARTEKPDPSAPKQGLLVQNRTESLRYVLLDGVVLARVLPRRDAQIEGLLPGKYALVSLDFLGDDPTPLRILELPARVALGESVETER